MVFLSHSVYYINYYIVLARRDLQEATATFPPPSQQVCGFLDVHWELGVPNYHCPRFAQSTLDKPACLVRYVYPEASDRSLHVCEGLQVRLDKASTCCRGVQLPCPRQAAASLSCSSDRSTYCGFRGKNGHPAPKRGWYGLELASTWSDWTLQQPGYHQSRLGAGSELLGSNRLAGPGCKYCLWGAKPVGGRADPQRQAQPGTVIVADVPD